MYVCGFASTSSMPPVRISMTEEASRSRPRPPLPALSAMRSRTIQPTLCRVSAYWLPGFPRPTTSFTFRSSPQRPAGGTPPSPGHGERPRDGVRRGSPAMVSRPGVRLPGEQVSLERAHRGLLVRLRVVPAADVERAVGHEEAELVASVPAHVAGVAAPSLLRLVDGPFDGDDDVAEVLARARREGEGAGFVARAGGRLARVPRVCLGREERE